MVGGILRKDELLARIARDTGQNLTYCTTLYNITICMITLALKNGGSVDISGFGTFSTGTRGDFGVDISEFSGMGAKNRIPIFTPSEDLVIKFNRRVEPHKGTHNSTRECSATFDGNLNTISKLGALGYSVQLSREERWRILTRKAIPKYGIDSVQNHIAWLIRLKKKDSHRDYRSAIFEWEYDLKKLNNYRV